MKRFFAIVGCLVFGISVFAATPHPQSRSATKSPSAITVMIRLVEWRLGLVVHGDELRPPFPPPESRPSTCCK